jgi:hypothetical protein
LPDWSWANPTYEFMIENDKKIRVITIDASKLMADINLSNNTYELE